MEQQKQLTEEEKSDFEASKKLRLLVDEIVAKTNSVDEAVSMFIDYLKEESDNPHGKFYKLAKQAAMTALVAKAQAKEAKQK